MATDFVWRQESPENHGLSPGRLEAWQDGLAARGTTGLLLIRHDRVVYEWYASGHGPDIPHYTASLAKALVGGLSLILALGDSRLAPDEPAARLVPEWHDAPKSRITIRHLATHSSGIEDAETPGHGHFDQGGWKEAFWRREPDPFTIARDSTPLIFEPGGRYAYSNPGMAMLAYAVTAAFRDSEWPDLRTLLRERVMRRIGVDDRAWSIGYGQTYEVNGLPLVANWGGGAYTARAVARIGRLMMHRGEWLGAGQILPAAWVDRALTYDHTPAPERPPGNPAPLSGLGWWLNTDGIWAGVPVDAFAGAGAGNQILLVVPSLDVILVRNGEAIGDPAAGEGFWGGALKYLFSPLMEALTDRRGPGASPYPPSDTIPKARFAPVQTITRRGIDSDNWPVTWGDDDLLYTAYGDGWGFEPHTDRKLSLGLGTVAGAPPEISCRNLWSETGERLGDGRRGLKASGLLMVDGVLYMWTRNADNAQLAWSLDHGATWTWADWRFTTSFGCPTFLNYGPNYRGARDDYVYVYSQDGPTAYEPYDSIVLARVHRRRVRDREAYAFFGGHDESGLAIWTPDIACRAPVFSYTGRCQRLDAAYHPGLKRYLLAVGYNHRGGWGIYDAPRPWGPWTTVFHTHYWGLGNTHYYRLPAKWINADNNSLWLIFSGRTYDGVMYDAMCLRELYLGESDTTRP